MSHALPHFTSSASISFHGFSYNCLSLPLSFRSSPSFLPFSLKPDTSFSRTFPFIFFYSHSFFIFFFFVTILLLSLTSYIRPSSRIAHTLNDVSPSPSLSHFLSFSCFPLSCDPLFPHPTTACSFSPSSTSSPSPSHSFCSLSSFARRALCTPSV